MPLHVSEMGIQVNVGGQPDAPDKRDGRSCGAEISNEQREAMVSETVRRVLQILQAREAR